MCVFFTLAPRTELLLSLRGREGLCSNRQTTIYNLPGSAETSDDRMRVLSNRSSFRGHHTKVLARNHWEELPRRYIYGYSRVTISVCRCVVSYLLAVFDSRNTHTHMHVSSKSRRISPAQPVHVEHWRLKDFSLFYHLRK